MNNENNTPSTPNMTTLRAVICGVLAAVFMVYNAIPSNIFAVAVIGIFIICAFIIKKNGASFALTLLITAFCFLFTSISGLAMVLGIASAAAIGSLMLRSKKNAAIYLCFAVLAYAVSAIITTPMTACSTLICLPAAAIIALCHNKKANRVSAVCTVSATFIITLLAPPAVIFLIKHGTEAPELLKTLGVEFFTSQRLLLASQFNEIFSEVYSELSSEISPDIIKSFSDALAEVMIQILPALLIICSNIAAFVTHSISLALRRFYREPLEEKETQFVLSKVSAWIFIISLALSLLSFSDSQTAHIVSASMMNINVILSISFFFVGFRSALAMINTFSRRKKVLHIILAVLALMYCGTFFTYPLIFIGVINTLKYQENKRTPPNS